MVPEDSKSFELQIPLSSMLSGNSMAGEKYFRHVMATDLSRQL